MCHSVQECTTLAQLRCPLALHITTSGDSEGKHLSSLGDIDGLRAFLANGRTNVQRARPPILMHWARRLVLHEADAVICK